MTFEEKLKKLEDLTNAVKKTEISLEDALKAFEDGIKTARELEKEISRIEGKVQILMNSPDFEDSKKTAESKEKPAKKKRGKSKKSAQEADFSTTEYDADIIYDTSSLEFALFDSPELKD